MSSIPGQRVERDAKIAELHERLTVAVEQLVSGDAWVKAIEFAARFRRRSFNNVLLIHVQHAAAYQLGTVPEPAPTFVAGFKQWQALGRRVTAGQHGYAILAPLTARFATADPADPGAWHRLASAERPRAGEVVRPKLVGVRPTYVWDVSQTDGRPLPQRPAPRLLRGEAPTGLWDALAALVDRAGFVLSSAPDATALGGANGLTNFADRTVLVRADLEPAAAVKTLAHELAHLQLHDPVAAPRGIGPLAGTNPSDDVPQHRGIAEVEAESVALMIGAAHGMDTSVFTVPYVSGWADSVPGITPVEVVQATGERVRRAAGGILDELRTPQLDDGDPVALGQVQVAAARSLAPTAPPNRAMDRISTRGLA
ncbi:ArdC family protein [Agromyces sp. Leaf222]|uniref:ArdC family protein n=1 Tax=Agromyces sp. Leaf222 TaxID=1735688 RepID=UPI0006FF4FC0|nr:ArdC family protein [Agromyces sp. Leaf222]KQM84631.1 serine/arginine repetitive matrix protein 2 [Agromyces sp. Leaf222]